MFGYCVLFFFVVIAAVLLASSLSISLSPLTSLLGSFIVVVFPSFIVVNIVVADYLVG
jgi:hypothetical protein